MLASLALGLAASASAAQPVSIRARFLEGKAAYSRTVKGRSGDASNATAVLKGSAGPRRVILNYLPLAAQDGRVDLQYQVELSRADGGDGPLLQAQGELVLRPGRPITALDCGFWKLEFSLGAGGEGVADGSFGEEDGNLRVTVAVAEGGERLLCAQLMLPGVTSNVSDSVKRGKEFSGLDIQTTAEPREDGVRLSCKVEHTPRSQGGRRVWKESSFLRYGERADAAGSAGRLGFLVEGSALPTARVEGGEGGSGGGHGPTKAPRPAGPVRWRHYRDETVGFDYPEGWTVKTIKGDDGVADGFQLWPPKTNALPEESRAWSFVPPYDPEKEVPGGDYSAYLYRLMKLSSAPEEAKLLVKPTRKAVKGGQCFWHVDESRDAACVRLTPEQRRDRSEGCYTAMHFQDCLSDKGLRYTTISPLAGPYRAPGRLGPEQEEMLGYARRRLDTFEFRGAVPKSAFQKD